MDIAIEHQGEARLENVDVVYVDSCEALQRAYTLGLPREAEIRTTAPGVLVSDSLDAVQADSHMDPETIWALDAAFVALQNACKGVFGNRDIDLIAARYATLEFQNPAYKAAIIHPADFTQTVAVIELSSSDPDLDRMIRSPLKHLLAENPNLIVLSVPIDSLPREDDPRAPSPTFLQRLRFSGLETILYRLIEKFATKHRLAGPRGRFIVLRENELCKETAWSMIKRGFLPNTFPVVSAKGLRTTPADKRIGKVEDSDFDRLVEDLISTHLGPFLRTDCVILPLVKLFSEAVRERAHRYATSQPLWEEVLQGCITPGRTAALTNWLNDPEALGLKHVLEEKNAPMVFFQHGVTNEMNWRMRQYEAQYGTSLCDLEMAFNTRAATLSMKNRFLRGRAIATGFPQDYYRGMRRKGPVVSDSPPIWYVCTAFYVANHGQLEGVTDWDKCRHETGVVTEVLDKCRHKVVFKPYPGRRYEDPDPIETAVENSTNIEMHRSRLDLRYVVRHARILISARSFSTPSWCLATDLPLVHINVPYQDPLDDEALEAFKKGVFLFDASEPDFHQKLLAFLNQPIEEIERKWVEKADARAELVRGFMSSYPGGAGDRAAKEIIKELKSRR